MPVGQSPIDMEGDRSVVILNRLPAFTPSQDMLIVGLGSCILFQYCCTMPGTSITRYLLCKMEDTSILDTFQSNVCPGLGGGAVLVTLTVDL